MNTLFAGPLSNTQRPENRKFIIREEARGDLSGTWVYYERLGWWLSHGEWQEAKEDQQHSLICCQILEPLTKGSLNCFRLRQEGRTWRRHEDQVAPLWELQDCKVQKVFLPITLI